jgi:hypothetical protein
MATALPVLGVRRTAARKVSLSGKLYGRLERTGLLARIGAEHVDREQPQLGAALNDATLTARTHPDARANDAAAEG